MDAAFFAGDFCPNVRNMYGSQVSSHMNGTVRDIT